MKQDVTEDLLIRYALGEASESEIKEVTTWINASAANARQFEQIKFILETSKNLAQVSPVSETEAWDRFKEKRGTTQRNTPVRSIVRLNSWLRIAAAVLLVTGAAWAGYYFYNLQGKAPAFITLTAYNKVLTDTLPDGSVVHLNKRSSITYASKFKPRREVKLTGEAFFDVVHDSSAPFTVHVGDVTVRDIGTSFNISSNSKRIEVIVENGIVEVSRKSHSLELQKQEMVTIKPGDKELHKEATKDLLYKYYRTNEFIANKTPLYRLVAMLNEVFGANIKIEGENVANTPIGGTFPASNPLDYTLKAIIETTPGIHMEKTKDGIVLK
jgi:ferric-dicitrate binding protein FerR (iron transport regulator)